MRTGGQGQIVSPQNPGQLVEVIAHLRQANLRFQVVGGGSNTLFPDGPYQGIVVSIAKLNQISFSGDEVLAGGGVRIQRLIRACGYQGLGGLEFLYSLPAMVGGLTAMNAGADHHKQELCFGRFVRKASVLKSDGSIVELSGPECNFGYRDSIFRRDKDLTILDVTVRLQKSSLDLVNKKIIDRTARVRAHQDVCHPNLGTIFRSDTFSARYGPESIGGARWSAMTQNWIINTGNAKSIDVLTLIDETIRNVQMMGQSLPQLEIEVIPCG